VYGHLYFFSPLICGLVAEVGVVHMEFFPPQLNTRFLVRILLYMESGNIGKWLTASGYGQKLVVTS